MRDLTWCSFIVSGIALMSAGRIRSFSETSSPEISNRVIVLPSLRIPEIVKTVFASYPPEKMKVYKNGRKYKYEHKEGCFINKFRFWESKVDHQRYATLFILCVVVSY